MATNLVKVTQSTGADVFAFHSSVYVPTGNNIIVPASATVVDLTMDEGGTGLADGAAVNSDKVDLGATRPEWYNVYCAIEWFAAATVGDPTQMYWSPSENSSAGIGNPGSPDGVDGLYTGDGTSSVAEAVLQMQPIGVLVGTDLVGVQIARVGTFRPYHRFGQLIVLNNSGALMCGTDDVESAIVFSSVVADIQAAA